MGLAAPESLATGVSVTKGADAEGVASGLGATMPESLGRGAVIGAVESLGLGATIPEGVREVVWAGAAEPLFPDSTGVLEVGLI
jgi:hypothetical protein